MGCGSSQEEQKEETHQERSAELQLRNTRAKKGQQTTAVASGNRDVSYATSAITCVAFDRNEKFVIVGTDLGDVRAVSLSSSGETVLWESKRAHGGAVTAISVTHKVETNTKAVTAGRDGKAIIWDAASGREIFTLPGHVLPINAVIFSRDDTKIYTGSSDKAIIEWDHRTRKSLGKLEGHMSLVWCLAISHDNRALFSGSEDETVIQWDPAKNKKVRVLRGHKGPVFSLMMSRDGLRVLSGSRDRTIRMWDIAEGHHTNSFEVGAAVLTSMALSKDGGKVFIGGAGVRCLDVGKRHEIIGDDAEIVNGVVTSLAVSMDNLFLAVGTSAGKLLKIDITDFVRPDVVTFHKGTVSSLTVSPVSHSSLVAAASEDTTISVWSFSSGRLVHRLEGHSSRVWCVSFSSDASELFSASEDSTIRVWDISTGKCTAVLKGHFGCVWQVTEVSASRLLSCGDDNTLRVWCLGVNGQWECEEDMTMRHDSSVVCCAQKDSLAVSGSFDQTVRCWSLETAEELASLEGHTEVVWGVAFAGPDRILSCSEDQTVRSWTITGQPLSVLDLGAPAGSLSFNPLNNSVIIGLNTGMLCMIPYPLPNSTAVDDCKMVKGAHSDSVCAVAYRGDAVLTGSVDMKVRYWYATMTADPIFKVLEELV